jgi:hypothetical protein
MIESLSTMLDEFNCFLKTPSVKVSAFAFGAAKQQRVSLENRLTV